MFRSKRPEAKQVPVPARLPPLEGLERAPLATGQPRHTWLWTLVVALIVVLLLAYIVALGIMGVYDGLKERAQESGRIAQEHYLLGLEHLQAENYELAIGEFELALRHDSSLQDARLYLREAKEKARALVQPTSETRQEAARLLYQQAVAEYESGNLRQAVAILDELRGIDPAFQVENVTIMLTTAHHRLGLDAVAGDNLDDATAHFETILSLKPEDKDAQDQINLIRLYTAALNYWDRDWPATIQALKGLYALAPDYKDVQARLHAAYVYNAEARIAQDEWCQAADQYAAAVEVLPREDTVDQRDEARIRCQAARLPATATRQPTATRATAPRPTATSDALLPGSGTAAGEATPASQATPSPQMAVDAQGRIAFPSFDAVRQQEDIYLVDLAQRDARLLVSNAHQPAFGPSGSRLAVRSLDPQHLGLSIYDLGGTQTGEMTTHAEDSAPAWSPDGGQIVFASNKHGDRKWRLYVISPGQVRGEGQEWGFGRLPAWSPAGSQIAYHGCDERGDNCGIWLIQPGGFSPARLTTHASDTAPAWSPDGSQVAFVSTRTGNWELFVIDIATGQERRLTDHTADDLGPVWSPNGRQIAFLSNRGGVWAIYILDLKSGREQKLIATGDNYPDPTAERLAWIP
ncbi:MAG: PD40 domain-containing protein [Anaerolineae bacterium]|nr:PD40 domain-containing protein [Anaerolineae bacterium]